MSEYRQKDADGRIPLSYREYSALRGIFSAVNALTIYHKELERRTKGYKNGWRDLRCLVSLSEKVMEDVLKTIPRKKLLQIRRDLDNTVCELKPRGIVNHKEDGFFCVSENTLIELCEAATELNCFGCEKSNKEANKDCKLYKIIQSVFNYEFEESDHCPMADKVIE